MNYCYNCMRLVDGEKCSECGYKKDSRDIPLHHLPPGSVLRDRYIIGNSIGEGGFGITYIGRDKNLDIRVAVKEYYPQGYANRYNISTQEVTATVNNKHEYYQKGKERFLQEARLLAMFSGESSIVTVRDYFEANNTAYIVMEYLDGITLKEDLKLRGSFMFDELIELMTPLCIALGKIHKKGLIHRDISPDNIMFMPDGSLKLMDFGSVRGSNFDTKRSLSIILKPGYAPEEQYRTKGTQGPWTDIYALCATIYKCITCITPDNSLERMHCDELKKPSELGVKIERKQESALMKGLSVYQNDRFKSIEEFLTALGIDVNKDTNIAVHRRRIVGSDESLNSVQPVANDALETALMIEDEEPETGLLIEDEEPETGLLIEDEEPETGLLVEDEKPETALLAEDEQSADSVNYEDEMETAPLVDDELSSMDKQSEADNLKKVDGSKDEFLNKSETSIENNQKNSTPDASSNKVSKSPLSKDNENDIKEVDKSSKNELKKSKKKYGIIALIVLVVLVIGIIVLASQCSSNKGADKKTPVNTEMVDNDSSLHGDNVSNTEDNNNSSEEENNASPKAVVPDLEYMSYDDAIIELDNLQINYKVTHYFQYIKQDEDGNYYVNGDLNYVYESREDAEELLLNYENTVEGEISANGTVTSIYDEKIGNIDEFDNGTVNYQSYSQGTDLSEVGTLEIDVVHRSLELNPAEIE